MPTASPPSRQEPLRRASTASIDTSEPTWAEPPEDLHPDALAVLRLLDEARDRTFRLISPVSDDDWSTSHDPVMGPVAWDVAHMGNQEELWCHQVLGGQDALRAGFNDRYHAYKNPRPHRARLPLLSKQEVLDYRQEVAACTARTLAAYDPASDDPHWHDLYVPKLMVLHEYQHDETILQAVYGFPQGHYVPVDRRPAPRPATTSMTRTTTPAPVETHPDGPLSWVHHEGGPTTMGVPQQAWTYDNEWPPTEVDLAPFWLAAHPVTHGKWLRFIEDGGYEDPSWWNAEGHAKLMERGWRAPAYWVARPDGWRVRAADRLLPLETVRACPVMNITWYEADAFARWAGLRLPTEQEWEHAATWDPATGTKRRWPWGDAPWTPAYANLDQARFMSDPVGSHPEGATPAGVHQMVGDVWEWTATEFRPYPGFEPFPYRDYSERFYDKGLMVLRGGSWATRPGLRLGTFRNWDLPIRRQIFSGLRLAADDDGPDAPVCRPGTL